MYAFVLNSPTIYFDSNGEYTLGEWMQIGGGALEGLGIGAGNVGGAAWGLVKSPYTVTKGLSSAAGTLSTEYGRDQLGRKLSLAKLLTEKFAKDPCFRKQVLAKLGAEAKDYFTDPYKLSELLSNIGVAAGTAGLGAAGESGQLAEKLGELIKVLDRLSPEGKALAEVLEAAKNPVDGLPRMGSGLKDDIVKAVRDAEGNIIKEFPATAKGHGFPDIVDNWASMATEYALSNGAKLYQLEASYNGVAGRFEWIVENGQVTHRMFVAGGKVTGVAIKP